jgi:hypothetical protein
MIEESYFDIGYLHCWLLAKPGETRAQELNMNIPTKEFNLCSYSA